MMGKGFIGKILFRAEDAAPDASFGMALFGLDCILAGHLAQAPQIGDDPVYKTGAYKGKGLNKPPEGYSGETPPSSSSTFTARLEEKKDFARPR